MSRKISQLIVSAIACIGFTFTAATSYAASLADGQHWIVGSSNSGNESHNISVFPGNAGFSGSGANGAVDETFGDPVIDYRFFNDGGSTTTANTYANGAADLISDINGSWATGFFGNDSAANLWETTDPGVGFSSSADYTSNTGHSNTTSVEGDIDISGLASGSVYFFYGAFRSTPDIDLTMTDTDGAETAIELFDVGDNDFANGNEYYAYRADFVNDAGYDVLSYVHTNLRVTGNGGSGRHAGTVVTGVLIPEPSTAALSVLGLGLIAMRRRRA